MPWSQIRVRVQQASLTVLDTVRALNLNALTVIVMLPASFKKRRVAVSFFSTEGPTLEMKDQLISQRIILNFFIHSSAEGLPLHIFIQQTATHQLLFLAHVSAYISLHCVTVASRLMLFHTRGR